VVARGNMIRFHLSRVVCVRPYFVAGEPCCFDSTLLSTVSLLNSSYLELQPTCTLFTTSCSLSKSTTYITTVMFYIHPYWWVAKSCFNNTSLQHFLLYTFIALHYLCSVSTYCLPARAVLIYQSESERKKKNSNKNLILSAYKFVVDTCVTRVA